jgi:hypothetical protein
VPVSRAIDDGREACKRCGKRVRVTKGGGSPFAHKCPHGWTCGTPRRRGSRDKPGYCPLCFEARQLGLFPVDGAHLPVK